MVLLIAVLMRKVEANVEDFNEHRDSLPDAIFYVVKLTYVHLASNWSFCNDVSAARHRVIHIHGFVGEFLPKGSILWCRNCEDKLPTLQSCNSTIEPR